MMEPRLIYPTTGMEACSMTDNEARSELRQLDDRIASLENELQQLKQQRVTQQGRSPKPLDGVRVLDLSRYIFGPFCTQTLGDLGADIIKVEPRQGGDPARYIGGPAEDGVSVSFLARNRNKRSLAMDMRKPAAQDILRRLAEQSDVLIHNFRPGIMDRMGLATTQLRELNPTLIYCSLSGYGQSGPMTAWPGQDLLIQGMSGIISTTGWTDGPPVAAGVFLADMTGAITATYGVLLALQARHRHGIGQEMDVSLLDAMIALQSMDVTAYLNSHQLPGKSGSGHWMSSQPYGIFRTADKLLVLNASSEDWWGRLCKAPEFVTLAADARFATRESRRQHGPALIAVLEAILRNKTRDEWLDYLSTFDVLCTPVYDYEELFNNPQVHHNDMVVTQQHPQVGDIRVIGMPVKFSKTPGDIRTPAPLLGQHTDDILQNLGYSAHHIAQLRQDEVI
ncbi:MAG: CoA transferase [bacterium]|nr:CoA transferase [bacterium]